MPTGPALRDALRTLAVACLVGLAPAASAAEPTSRTLVYLVRHAEKAAEPWRDPGLTPAGRERAEALAAALASARLTGAVTSQFRRTRATAAPTVRASGVEPVSVRYRPGELEAHGEAVAATIRERFRGGIVLVVGHSDTVPAIVRALGGPAIERLCEPTEYASLFILAFGDAGPASLVRSRYGRPDPPLPPECRPSPSPGSKAPRRRGSFRPPRADRPTRRPARPRPPADGVRSAGRGLAGLEPAAPLGKARRPRPIRHGTMRSRS